MLAVLPQRAFTPQEADRPDLAADRRARPPPPGHARHRRASPCSSPARSATSRNSGTLDFSEQFRETPESVEGLRILQDKFPPGQPGPVDLLVPQAIATATTSRRSGMDLAQSVDLVGSSRDGKLALIRITLLQDPFTEMATAAIPLLRENAQKFSPQAHGRRPDGGGARLRDRALPATRKLIIPLALALVFLIVAALLRSLIAPIYVVATVILSYAFALGVSALIFPETDPAMPLFTFIFLVALGVDYNVFLLTRIKEARRDHSHEDAVIIGLERTGGVITSAGLILAGTFCTLLATELESLFQVGFTVALGLLVDTFLIRIFLVPSIALLLRSKAL